MQATEQKPSALPKKKIGWDEEKFIKEILLIKGHHMVAFLWLIIYLNIHKQAKSRHGKMETVVLI